MAIAFPWLTHPLKLESANEKTLFGLEERAG